ncbi:MAG: maleylacetoacetate isomerase [Bdellovibrionia bacterium]
MAEVKLYNYFRSSTSYRVRIALNLKNISYQYIPIHLLQNGGEQHQLSYKTLNPMSEVPTIEHQGFILGQSLPIMEYLDESFPGAKLLPADPRTRGLIRQFCENINAFMHPLGNLKVLQYLENKHQYSQEQKNAWVQHWTNKGLIALEESAQKHGGKFVFGDNITLADICLVPQLFTCQRFGLDTKQFSKLSKIESACLSLEPFIKAHPFRQPDTPEEFRVK